MARLRAAAAGPSAAGAKSPEPTELSEFFRLNGNDAYVRREFDTAISAYGAGISARAAAGLPPDRRLFSNRAAAYVSKYLAVREAGLSLRGLLTLAVTDAAAATAVAPAWPKGWYRLYVAHAAAGDIAAARAAVQRGLAHCPRDPDLSRAAAELDAAVAHLGGAMVGPPPGDKARREADAAFRAGDWGMAIDGYTRSIRAAEMANAPPDRRAYSNRSAAWLRTAILTDEAAAFASAIADADMCIQIDPDWPKAWYRKAAAYLEDGRPGRAKDVFEDGLKKCPADGELRAGLMQAVRVIDEEGAETDWEDGSNTASPITQHEESEEEDVQSEMNVSPSLKTPSVEKGTTVSDPYGTRELYRMQHPRPALFTAPAPYVSRDESSADTSLSEDSLSFADTGDASAMTQTEAGVNGRLTDTQGRGEEREHGTAQPTSGGHVSTVSSTHSEAEFDRSFMDHLSPGIERQPSPVDMHMQHTTGGILRDPQRMYVSAAREHKHSSLPRDNISEAGERPRSVRIAKSAGVEEGAPRDDDIAEDEAQSSARRLKSAPAVGMQDVVDEEDGDEETERARTGGTVEGIREAKESEQAATEPTRKKKEIAETLYELLGVTRTATEGEIKKAYYELARQLHPDKNQSDPDATHKFQKLADAYRVLSNAKSRALYDKYGERELARNGVETVDPSTLFAMVFGSDHFGHLIGELQVASLANAVDEHGNAPPAEILEDVQKERVGKLAVHLIRMLQPWVDGDRGDFLAWATAEARRLADANFGVQLLHVVGRAYAQCAAVGLASSSGRKGVMSIPKTLSGAVAGGMYRTHRMRAQFRASAAATRVMHKQRRLHDKVMRLGRGGKSLSAAEAERIAVDMAESAVDMMWKLAVVDVESTVADVVAAALSARDLGEEVATAVRERVIAERARGLRVLGRAFTAARASRGRATAERHGVARRLPTWRPGGAGAAAASS